MVHTNKSMLAGKAARIQEHIRHPSIKNFGGMEIKIIDWSDRVDQRMIEQAKIDYDNRVKVFIPNDGQILCGTIRNKLGGTVVLVHIREIQI